MNEEQTNSEKTKETPLTTSSKPSETLTEQVLARLHEKKPAEAPPMTLSEVQDMRQRMLQGGPETVAELDLRRAIAFLRESRVSAMDSGKKKKAKKEKGPPIDTDRLLEDF